MTRIQGGKKHTAPAIARAMKSHCDHLEIDFSTVDYKEPFGGMLSVAFQVRKLFRPKSITVSDINSDLMAMWAAVRDSGWLPSPAIEITREMYAELAKDKLVKGDKYAPMRGFVGHIASFSGAYFGGYAPDIELNPQPLDGMVSKGISDLSRVGTQLKHMKLLSPRDFTQWHIEPGNVVYCDPPCALGSALSPNPLYREFDHARFWAIMDMWVEKGAYVFVSARSAPSHWTLIWKPRTQRRLPKNFSVAAAVAPDKIRSRTLVHSTSRVVDMGGQAAPSRPTPVRDLPVEGLFVHESQMVEHFSALNPWQALRE